MEMPWSTVGHIHMYMHTQFTVCDTRPLSSLAERHPKQKHASSHRWPPTSPEESLFMRPPRPGRLTGFPSFFFFFEKFERKFLPCCRLCATTHICMEPSKAAQRPSLVSVLLHSKYTLVDTSRYVQVKCGSQFMSRISLECISTWRQLTVHASGYLGIVMRCCLFVFYRLPVAMTTECSELGQSEWQ